MRVAHHCRRLALVSVVQYSSVVGEGQSHQDISMSHPAITAGSLAHRVIIVHGFRCLGGDRARVGGRPKRAPSFTRSVAVVGGGARTGDGRDGREKYRESRVLCTEPERGWGSPLQQEVPGLHLSVSCSTSTLVLTAEQLQKASRRHPTPAAEAGQQKTRRVF